LGTIKPWEYLIRFPYNASLVPQNADLKGGDYYYRFFSSNPLIIFLNHRKLIIQGKKNEK